MRRISTLLVAGLCAGIFSLHTPAQAAAEMSLMRLADCGTPQAPVPVNERFWDTFSYGDLKIQFVFSCYLIKHGDQYLLWDTGHSMTAPNVAPKVSIVDQLDKIGVKSPSRSPTSASAIITPTIPARSHRFRRRRC